ncbi:MAG: recombinase family protein [Lachnospiraceae bacterium]|nr:recombinase family protein [Lachnospiraceae bacterium]
MSTDFEEQLTSYAAQVDYYTHYIKSREDWAFVDVYTDEGITGTNTKKREGFNQMIADALDGKIDLIITKSVSRFARNTVDSLSTIRKLKEKGVEVYFEKENIWTFDGKGELLITIMSSLAQEESRSISENCIWGQRKRFADGKVTVPFARFLGYDRSPDGSLIVNPSQAAVVQRIFTLCLGGMTPYSISRTLTGEKIKTPTGKDTWNVSTVRSILTNEKYKGDALLQKTYTTDFLTKKRKINEGEIRQYYVENDHEAIIDPHTFDLVQRELARRSRNKQSYSGLYTFSAKIKCGQCGSWYGSKVWHSNDKYRRFVWQCNHKFHGSHNCSTPHLTDTELKNMFVIAANQLFSQRKHLCDDYAMQKERLYATASLEARQQALAKEMQAISDRLLPASLKNKFPLSDRQTLQAYYNKLTNQLEGAKEAYDQLSMEISEMHMRKSATEDFFLALRQSPETITDFDERIWRTLIDHVVVYSKEDVRFVCKNGTEITCAGRIG